VWLVGRDDIDRVMAELADAGVASSTRAGYLQVFKGFYAFMEARHAVEVQQRFGVVMVNPVDMFNSPVHVGSGWDASRPPPSPARLDAFFAFLREQIATARKYGTAGRDYALFRTLYHAGLRSDEAARLELSDVHLDRGPFGKLHVRFGKGTRTSGPRARWVPLLDGLDLILGWYLAEIRPRFGTGPALFCDEGGGAIHRGTVGNRLRVALAAERAGPEGHFSPHDLRHACATHNYERGVDLVAIQQLLGHWQIGTTMRYVSPSSTFIEDAYRRALSANLAQLEGGDE
jgi:site-specific recombinase XerD